MIQYTAIEYLAIDISNQYGLDKEEFETRIDWVKSNQHHLLDLADDAEEPDLFYKAVVAFNKALQGLPVGHTVALDAVCSGLQLMSVLSGCKSGCNLTGIIDPDVRADAYTKITSLMNELLTNAVVIERKDAKKAIMTAYYASKRMPKKIFGDETEEYFAFYDTLKKHTPGAFWLLHELIAAWDANTYAHQWTLPDGFLAFVPIMVEKNTRVSVAELSYTMSVQYYENDMLESGISLPANVTHSVDAYVLRTMIRRCNYAVETPTALKRLKYIKQNRLEGLLQDDLEDEDLIKYVGLYETTSMADTVIVPYLNLDNINQLSDNHIDKLINLIEDVCSYPAFEIITIHDSYACHPNHCDRLRYWYKEILAELAESTTLAHILTQLWHKPISFKPLDKLGESIRQSNYGIN